LGTWGQKKGKKNLEGKRNCSRHSPVIDGWGKKKKKMSNPALWDSKGKGKGKTFSGINRERISGAGMFQVSSASFRKGREKEKRGKKSSTGPLSSCLAAVIKERGGLTCKKVRRQDRTVRKKKREKGALVFSSPKRVNSGEREGVSRGSKL